MRYAISCNILDVSNKFSFAYRGLAPELRIFIVPSSKLTKASDFIAALKKKKDCWIDMPFQPLPQYNSQLQPRFQAFLSRLGLLIKVLTQSNQKSFLVIGAFILSPRGLCCRKRNIRSTSKSRFTKRYSKISKGRPIMYHYRQTINKTCNRLFDNTMFVYNNLGQEKILGLRRNNI